MKLHTLLKLTVGALLLLTAVACGSQPAVEEGAEQTPEMTDITLMLDWVPNTNHTGLFVAQQNGWYEEAGLNVEIIQPGEADVHQAVATGSADFGVSYQEGTTFARAEGIPIVSVAAVIQHNTSGFAARGGEGIEQPADFAGKTYGSFGSPIERPMITELMACDGAAAENVEFIDVGFADFLSMTEREVDFAWIFYGWDGINAEMQGIDLDIVMLQDWTECVPDYYTPILITNETMIADSPEIVDAFVDATTRGYEFAIENPDGAADALLAESPESDEALVRASQAWLADQYQADAPQWGTQTLEIWQGYGDWLVGHDILTEPFDGNAAFTNEFIEN